MLIEIHESPHALLTPGLHTLQHALTVGCGGCVGTKKTVGVFVGRGIGVKVAGARVEVGRSVLVAVGFAVAVRVRVVVDVAV